MFLFQIPDEAERESILVDLLDPCASLSTDVSLRALSQCCPVSTVSDYLLCLCSARFQPD